jgi:rod shape-determining protein MreD
MRKKSFLRYIVYGLVVFILLSIQSSNLISLFDITPDMVLILVIIHSFHYGEVKGEIFGFVVGILEDAMSGTLFGLNAFILTLIGFLTSVYKKYIFVSDVISFLIYVMIATIIKYVLFIVFSLIFGQGNYLSWMTVLKLLGEIVYNLLIGAVFFYLSPVLYKKEENPF